MKIKNLFFFWKDVLKILLIYISVFSLSCGENAFKELTTKTTDEALLFDAAVLINQGEYTSAIAKINAMTTNGRTSKEAYRLLASAYAGRCGFLFFTFLTNLSAATGTLFAIFMKTFTTTTVIPSDCYQSQLALEGGYGGTASNRPTDINFLLALIGISKIGTTLRADADADKDGVVDAAYSSCDNTKISDADIKQVITGLGLLIANITAVSATLASGVSTAITNLQTACAAIPGDPLAGCSITDPNSASLNAGAVGAMRDLLKEQTYGIESCVDPTFTTCC